MHTFQDLEDVIGITVPHIRKLARFVYPGVKLFTDEQVQHLIEVRAEMNAGLSWKELEARHTAKEETEPKEKPRPDSAIQQGTQENVGELKQKIHQVGNRVVASLVVKDATDSVRNLPHMYVAAHLYTMKHGDELMEESLDAIDKAINDEPNGSYTESFEMVAELVDSSYEQGKRITGMSSHGDFAALEAAEKEDPE